MNRLFIPARCLAPIAFSVFLLSLTPSAKANNSEEEPRFFFGNSGGVRILLLGTLSDQKRALKELNEAIEREALKNDNDDSVEQKAAQAAILKYLKGAQAVIRAAKVQDEEYKALLSTLLKNIKDYSKILQLKCRGSTKTSSTEESEPSHSDAHTENIGEGISEDEIQTSSTDSFGECGDTSENSELLIDIYELLTTTCEAPTPSPATTPSLGLTSNHPSTLLPNAIPVRMSSEPRTGIAASTFSPLI